MPQRAVQRATKIADLTDDANQAALETGLYDSQSALLAAAKEDQKDQAKVIKKTAEENKPKPPNQNRPRNSFKRNDEILW